MTLPFARLGRLLTSAQELPAHASDTDLPIFERFERRRLRRPRPSPEISFVPNMAGSSDTWPSQHFELLRTFRSALACKDVTTNNSEQLRQIILKATSLSDWAVWSVVEQSSKQIGIEHFGAHDLRRTCAKLCRKNGGDLEQIKFLLGHSSIQTTERYLGSDQDIEIAVNDNLGL